MGRKSAEERAALEAKVAPPVTSLEVGGSSGEGGFRGGRAGERGRGGDGRGFRGDNMRGMRGGRGRGRGRGGGEYVQVVSTASGPFALGSVTSGEFDQSD